MCSNRSEPAARPIADLARDVQNLLHAMDVLGLALKGDSLAELQRALIAQGATPAQTELLLGDAELLLAFPCIAKPEVTP
jgi:hypothetical protein